MADKKISALTAVTSLSNTDAFPVVQGAQTKKATIADIKTYLPTASSTQTGLLSNTDWSTFNNKQSALTFGNLTEATSSVLTITGATGAIIGSGATIQVKQASGSQAGYLSSTDWTTFNTKQNSLTLTTTGTGAATLVGSTLNIPTGITAALTSLNGQSGSSQTFATATTGTDFTIASVGDVHTFAIPSASASNRGLLTSTDWSAFNSKEPALTKGNLTETTSSVLTITGGTGSVIGSGTTIAVTRATALADGYLKASDFSTFAAKQDAITLTTTGTSGAATLIGSTLNIPQYSGGGITSLNTATGSIQDFDTSTNGTDFSITTNLDTHTFNLPSSSATNRGLLTSSDWTNFNDAYSNRITALTTTGTSGAATLSSNTLNIPNYADTSQTAIDIQSSFAGLGSSIKGFQVNNPSVIVSSQSTMTSGQLFFYAYYLPKAVTITGVKWFQSTVGNYTGNNYNGIALYSYSGGTLTLVASSTNDANIWAQAGNNAWKTKAFSSTYSASAGIYFVAGIYSQSAVVTAPSIGTFTSLSNVGVTTYDFTNSARIAGVLSAQTSLPSSQSISGLTGTTTNNVLYLY